MKSLDEILQRLRQERPYLQTHYHVEKLAIFGSYVRSEQQEDSDLDVLVTFSETPSLLTLINMENYLSDQLGVDVDLVMESALRARIAQQAQQDLVTV